MKPVGGISRSDWVTKAELSKLMNTTAGTISKAIQREAIDAPVLVVFPAGNSITAWHRSYVDEVFKQCKRSYQFPYHGLNKPAFTATGEPRETAIE